MTYSRGLFVCRFMMRWDMFGTCSGSLMAKRASTARSWSPFTESTIECLSKNDTEKTLVVNTVIRNGWEARVFSLELTGWPHRSQERSCVVQKSWDLQTRRLEVVVALSGREYSGTRPVAWEFSLIHVNVSQEYPKHIIIYRHW